MHATRAVRPARTCMTVSHISSSSSLFVERRTSLRATVVGKDCQIRQRGLSGAPYTLLCSGEAATFTLPHVGQIHDLQVDQIDHPDPNLPL